MTRTHDRDASPASGEGNAEATPATLRAQTLLACPACGAPFKVVVLEGRRIYQCDQCGTKLELGVPSVGANPAAAVSPPARAPEGKPFGKYVLLRKVGEGGFGAVYKAYESGLGRTVALKFLHTENPEDVQRFVRESQTAAQLAHPHIVPLYEVGEIDGKHFLAMEFIEGTTLAKLRVEPKRAVEILRDVAGAVQYAHEKGIIHRDLKPQNLMIDGGDATSGHVWVLDFGLARQLRGGSTLTLSGKVVGTPAYMPPEQAEGKRCDERSDVYSLGATLYELVTGHPPFEGSEPLTILDRVRTEDPVSPRRYNPRLDPEIGTMIAKAMDKTPGRRYASAQAFAEDLRRHLQGEPVLARPPSMATKATKWMNRHRAISAVGTLLLLVAGVAASLILRSAAVRAATARQAREAEASGNEEEAARLWDHLDALGDPTAKSRADAARRRARDLAARHSAELLAAEAGTQEREFAAVTERLEALSAEIRSEEGRVGTWESAQKKATLWSLEREREEKRRARRTLEAQIQALYASALRYRPGDREIAASLGRFQWARMEEAEGKGETDRADFFEAALRLLARENGLAELAQRLEQGGTLDLDSVPSGAEVALQKYEEAPDRRLLPRHLDGLGSCPIPHRKLERGSYLAILRKDGFRDVWYPLLIERGTAHRGTVNLYTEEEIGREFLYVPAGKFVMGGDPEAFLSGPRDSDAETGDFFIAKYPVTCEEYAKFLNDRDHHTTANAFRRSPRETWNADYHWMQVGEKIVMDDWYTKLPVFGISWEDACEYCRWRTKREGGKRTYRLPRSIEYEKAARGADGRLFPWGNHLDWSFTKGKPSRTGEIEPEPPGTFEKDESPYGVRDLAGNMRTWCEDWRDEETKYVRGGPWTSSDVWDFRSASRTDSAPAAVFTQIGLRLVLLPPPR